MEYRYPQSDLKSDIMEISMKYPPVYDPTFKLSQLSW